MVHFVQLRNYLSDLSDEESHLKFVLRYFEVEQVVEPAVKALPS